MSEPILQLSHVNKQYRDFALKDVSFQLPKGSIMGFIGENGAGKTTVIKLILNQVKKSSGAVTVFGLDHIEHEKKIKAAIGVVLDECNFPESLTVKEIPTILKKIYTDWDTALYLQYCNRFQLPMRKAIKEFSRGMKMKLLISCALAHHPKLLILDEATSGLDPVVRNEILDVFLDFIQDDEHSILISSHIISDLEKIADYITFIHEGEIIFSESKDKLVYEYGLLKCKYSDFEKIDHTDIVSYRKNQFTCEALVKSKSKFQREHANLVVDNISLEDIMLLLIKGERLC